MIDKKYNNSLIALAFGDSYGMAYEYDSLMGISFKKEKLPDYPKIAKITDDTKMALMLYNHYLEYKTIKEDILFEEYKKWAQIDGIGDGIGIHTAEVLLDGKKDKDSQGNGALMRNIPFGIKLIEDGFSFKEAVKLMNIDSALTHANDVIFLSNELALDIALNGIEVINKEKYKNLVKQLHFDYSAWVINTLYVVIEVLKKNLNFLDGFKEIVAMGGDTDTNCAIYGAIKGAKDNIQDELDINVFLGEDIKYFIKE
ncbi:ADP-ribosylglycohydrolase family protein [Caminibacter mediatlanticus TB-2]|uniref:ADP-ribosylglycohydrolase family protein n=1 Tax=Caminibacter mediatlanticus TB-2 TaxID=391592 RepID=A0ABX5VA00_9BACT|nr:ADP-ribosylglycohydrolase family protein [Caminibacter mediatlanticus]QCT95026.1 ADP-ribosylglycohydrolase family protein [Caminibacter mediatlanticus TB-2]